MGGIGHSSAQYSFKGLWTTVAELQIQKILSGWPAQSRIGLLSLQSRVTTGPGPLASFLSQVGKTRGTWVLRLAAPLSVWDLTALSTFLSLPFLISTKRVVNHEINNSYLAGLLGGYRGRVCVNHLTQHLAPRETAAGVPSLPASQRGLGKAHGRLGGRGRMFLEPSNHSPACA